jgi:hypothetical protein
VLQRETDRVQRVEQREPDEVIDLKAGSKSRIVIHRACLEIDRQLITVIGRALSYQLGDKIIAQNNTHDAGLN